MVGYISNLVIMELLPCLEKDHCRLFSSSLLLSFQGLMHNKKAIELGISSFFGFLI